MSLILDALKKSEQERRRDRVPDLQSIHQAAPTAVRRREVRWRWILLIAVNAIAVAVWWFRYGAVTQQAAPVVAAIAPAAPASTEPASVSVATRPATTPIPASGATTAAPEAEFTRIEPRVASVRPIADSTAPIEEFSELAPDLRNALPAMTFSFHVYSADPQNRTIIINNQRMREGDEISAGVRLQAITEDGVVLAMDHHRIHINVLTGW